MNTLKDQVISYLYMGLHPTVVSFQDDGLFYLFDKLLQGKTVSNSYDPTFTFVHVSLGYLDTITSTAIEQEINDALTRDSFDGDTIIETYGNGVETVCVIDDMWQVDTIPQSIQAIDMLIKKYRGILHFVYVIEDPLLLHNLRGYISPHSSINDAIMYQPVSDHWTTKELVDLCTDQFKSELPPEVIEEMSQKSNNHLGIFKRLYRDALLKTDATSRYVQLLIDNLDKSLVNTFKKVVHGKELGKEEQIIYEAYEKVGFIRDGEMSIPLIREAIQQTIIPHKVAIDTDTGKLTGVDLHEFNKTERAIIETLMQAGDVLTKSQIGDIIWGEKVHEKYSEWAIDQRIARLRKKIIDLGCNIDVQTVYGKGYKLVFINAS